MMFKKTLLTLVSLAVMVCTTVEGATRDGLMAMVGKKLDVSTRNLRSKVFLQAQDQTTPNSKFDICDMVKAHFGDAFQSSSVNNKGGHCNCSGTLRDGTTNVTCVFDHVCDGSDILCADIDVNITLTGILDERGRLGRDPTVNVSACMEPDMDELEQMCLTLDFAKPKFFLPSACSFSYGGTQCVCVIDDTVPCYDFDCSSALPEPMNTYIVSKACKTVDLTENGILDVSVFIPALADFPDGEKNPNSMQASFEEQAAHWVESNEGN